jgi:hypothetical protein
MRKERRKSGLGVPMLFVEINEDWSSVWQLPLRVQRRSLELDSGRLGPIIPAFGLGHVESVKAKLTCGAANDSGRSSSRIGCLLKSKSKKPRLSCDTGRPRASTPISQQKQASNALTLIILVNERAKAIEKAGAHPIAGIGGNMVRD